MTGYLWLAAYVVVVCALSAAATGQLLPRTSPVADGGNRGWFPGGEEEPEPAPQPEKHTPSWARQEAN